MADTPRKSLWIILLLSLIAGGAIGWGIYARLDRAAVEGAGKGDKPPAPVETAPVVRGSIELRRTFTGTLEARSAFLAAPKVSGRVKQLNLDIADEVSRGRVVALLDDAEYVQAVARAEADLEVARASNLEARNLLQIADRELKRVADLRERGVGSASQLDLSKAEQLAKQAQVKVTEARIASAEADLEAARIRLGYTQVDADWRGGGERRVVAERYVDEGETVAANTPLLRIVELDPITAVVFVTERDYGRLQPGQEAELATDAFPGERFRGSIERIAPVFREATRQARVELQVSNPGHRLKPGMFARAAITLERLEDAVIVPEQALTTRDDRLGLFLVSGDGSRALWREVERGISQDGRVQVLGSEIAGQVVVLGQQLLDDGAPLQVVEAAGESGR